MIKQIILSITFLFFCNIADAQPQLVLHFDVNGTVIASDRATHASAEEKIQTHLTKKYGIEGDFFTFLTTHPDISREYNALCKKLKQQWVFPSFYNLIDFLNASEIPYTLSIRTFGFDGPAVAQEIEKRYPSFFTDEGKYRHGVLFFGCLACHPDEAYDLFTKGNYIIQDDWQQWHDHHRQREFGKPLPIALDNDGILEIFFDDNITGNSPGIVAPINVQTGQFLDLQPGAHLVCVDTLEAIHNSNYFIEKLLECLKNAPALNIQASTPIETAA